MIEKFQAIREVFRALGRHESREPCMLILSCSSGLERASVYSVRSPSDEEAWSELEGLLLEIPLVKHGRCKDLIIERVSKFTALTLQQFEIELSRTKSNHFAKGLSLDSNCSRFFLNAELNCNAILYGGSLSESATLSVENLKRFGREKYGDGFIFENQPDQVVYSFETLAVYCGQDKRAYQLHSSGPLLGSRNSDADEEKISNLIRTASDFLGRQINDQGLFRYEVYPCFNQDAPLYVMTHHALAVFSMFEAWRFTKNGFLWSSAQSAMTYLIDNGLRTELLPDSSRSTFLLEQGSEIGLGGNALTLLAIASFTELSGDQKYLELMESLAGGILAMLNPISLQFVHVLNHPDLSPKEWHRNKNHEILAALALIRLYKINRRLRWLQAVEGLVDHWAPNFALYSKDPWLTLCIEDLMLFRPRARYGDLLLSIRGEQSTSQCLFSRLITGYVWPEQAMYFARPDLVVGGFVNRDRAFRIKLNELALRLFDMVCFRAQHQNVNRPIISRPV